MHIVSWNVNGVRAIIKKGFQDNIQLMAPDILCLQETKAGLEDTKTALTVFGDEYHLAANASKARKGYSGTAILSKEKPRDVVYDIGIEEHDQEGRVVTAKFESFTLVNVYVPNSGSGLKRLEYRETWDKAFVEYVKSLETENHPVIVCGDFNVAHEPIDLARPKENYNKTSGYTQKEIDGFDLFVERGFYDTFRDLHPDKVKYTFWNQRFGARERNVGWRIDYFLVSSFARDRVKAAEIYNDHMGSDHCPLGIRWD